jgi:hypothetical protein
MQNPQPVPLPDEAKTNHDLPTEREVQLVASAIATGAAGPTGLTPLQEMLLEAQCELMTGYPLDRSTRREVGPRELAEALADRDLIYRVRILQEIILPCLILNPVPPEIGQKVAAYARALSVGETAIEQIERYGSQSYDAALIDFARNGYSGTFADVARPALHTDHDIGDGWNVVDDDPALAARWAALEHCAPGTLGRAVFDFYRQRGFVWPGEPGSAPPLLAQHDFVHIVADFGTTLENELEVFGLIARADDNPQSFSLLTMVIGLFETGTVASAGGLFEADPGHLKDREMATRLADAMRRGALSRPDGDTPKAFLAIDWFDYVDMPVEEVRRRFQIPAKSQKAIDAGSLGPWDPGGISEFQKAAGEALRG